MFILHVCVAPFSTHLPASPNPKNPPSCHTKFSSAFFNASASNDCELNWSSGVNLSTILVNSFSTTVPKGIAAFLSPSDNLSAAVVC